MFTTYVSIEKKAPVNHYHNTIRLLRFPFSVFLLPVSLFSLFFIEPLNGWRALLLLAVWHLLVFPASNGYNSYHDQDEGPIGGLAAPPKPTRRLLLVSNLLDLSALLIAWLMSREFALFVLLYILASRLYSNRKVRLKRFPGISFILVFFFQGMWVFAANIAALSSVRLFEDPSVVYGALASSFLVGTMYPITQIYQHEADRKEGIKTLSMLLGKRATFTFSGILFTITALFLYLAFSYQDQPINFLIFVLVMLPALIYFLRWALRSYRNPDHVNFRNTMTMLILSTFLSNCFFLFVLIK